LADEGVSSLNIKCQIGAVIDKPFSFFVVNEGEDFLVAKIAELHALLDEVPFALEEGLLPLGVVFNLLGQVDFIFSHTSD